MRLADRPDSGWEGVRGDADHGAADRHLWPAGIQNREIQRSTFRGGGKLASYASLGSLRPRERPTAAAPPARPTTVAAICTAAGADRHWPDLGGCCAGLAATSEPRPAGVGGCAASHPQHGTSCWSTWDLCRAQTAAVAAPAISTASTRAPNMRAPACCEGWHGHRDVDNCVNIDEHDGGDACRTTAAACLACNGFWKQGWRQAIDTPAGSGRVGVTDARSGNPRKIASDRIEAQRAAFGTGADWRDRAPGSCPGRMTGRFNTTGPLGSNFRVSWFWHCMTGAVAEGRGHESEGISAVTFVTMENSSTTRAARACLVARRWAGPMVLVAYVPAADLASSGGKLLSKHVSQLRELLGYCPELSEHADIHVVTHPDRSAFVDDSADGPPFPINTLRNIGTQAVRVLHPCVDPAPAPRIRLHQPVC